MVRLVTEEREELTEEVDTLKGQCGVLVVERKQLEALVRSSKQDLRVMLAALNRTPPPPHLRPEAYPRSSALNLTPSNWTPPLPPFLHQSKCCIRAVN